MEVLTGKYRKRSEAGQIEVNTCNLKLNKRMGLWYRPDTCDLKMLKDGSGDYPTINCKDRIVFDCGSNVGGFLLKACEEEAKEVYAFEPEDFNFDILKVNAEILKSRYETKIHLIQKAIVPDDAETLQFNVTGSRNSACAGSLMRINGSVPITVECINFWKKLDEVKPDLIKMDIEGAEYMFIDRDFPEYVKEVVMELHGFKKEQNVLMHQYIERIKNDPNFEIVSLKFVSVFFKESLALLHYKRK